MLAGFVTGFAVSMLGWQINILSIHRGLEKGRSGPILVGLGAAFADSLIIFAASAGAAPLMDHPHFWTISKWFGITAVFLVSLRILFHKSKFKDPLEKKTRGPAQSFVMGFIVVVSNPAVYLLWAAAVSLIILHFQDIRIWKLRIFFLAGFFFGCFSWFSILAFFILKHIREWGESKLHLISRVCAVLLLTGAVLLMFKKF